MIRRRRRTDEQRHRVQLQAIAATADLNRHMPGWRPSPEHLAAMTEGTGAYTGAVHTLGAGWTSDDARWDLLTAVIEYNRRQPPAPTRRQAPEEPWWWEYAPEMLAGAQLVCLAVGAVQSRRKA